MLIFIFMTASPVAQDMQSAWQKTLKSYLKERGNS